MRYPTCLLALFLLTTPALAQQKLAYPKADPQEIYDAVEKPAVPAGGVAAYAQYLADHQQYPTAALRAGRQGTVNVTFIVEKTGSLSHVAVAQPLDPALDAEASRLVAAAPRWTPAEHKGQKVRQRVTVPVTFRIPGEMAPGAAPDSVGAAGALSETPARPVGGTEAFFAWLRAHQRYPALARQRKVAGRVLVEFLIQPDGSLTDAAVVKRLGSGLDEEAVRLIKAAPKWEPARSNGQPVKQKMLLPVVFTF